MNSSLFLLPDNFYAQMLNPSFMRTDEGRIYAFPGMAGFTIRNTGNFRFTDFIYTSSSGDAVLDFNRILQNGEKRNAGSEYFDLPLFYMAVPIKKGMFSLYYREKIQNSLYFPSTALLWFEHGNSPELYRNYDIGDIDLRFLGTHELAAGITKKVNKKIKAGIRGKLVFGAAFIEANNWTYGIYTSEAGDEVLLTSGGSGRLAIKFPVKTLDESRINEIDFENPLKNYLGNFGSPGVAFDAGITWEPDKTNQYSVALNDFGFVLFGNNARKMYQDGSYLFTGMDISNVIVSREGGDYVAPLKLMMSTKENIRLVYRPFYTDTKIFSGLGPKLFLNYKHIYTETFTAGWSNQTIFQKGYFLNTFSINALYSPGCMSYVTGLSLYNLSSVTLGGGIQWTNRNSQLFVFTDNLLALYHPATQKSYSITFGMNLLLDQDISLLKKKRSVGNGRISSFRPFYKKHK